MKYLIYVFFLFGLLSCVPQKQYAELQKENERLSQMVSGFDSLSVRSNYIEDDMQSNYTQVLWQNEQLRSTNTNLNKSYQELLKRYTRLVEQSKEIVDSQTRTTNQREQYLLQLEEEIKRREERLNYLEQNYNRDISARDQQIVQLQNELFRRNQELQRMRNALANVQANFPATDLDITERDGRLYVSLSQALLFRTGSARLDRGGRDAIRQIAEALTNLAGIEIVVEGHTDNQGNADRNWELSLDRALAVTQALTDNGIQPDRITAAGRGEYAPITTNQTENGRARNRRTEIILTPETVVGSGQ